MPNGIVAQSTPHDAIRVPCFGEIDYFQYFVRSVPVDAAGQFQVKMCSFRRIVRFGDEMRYVIMVRPNDIMCVCVCVGFGFWRAGN